MEISEQSQIRQEKRSFQQGSLPAPHRILRIRLEKFEYDTTGSEIGVSEMNRNDKME